MKLYLLAGFSKFEADRFAGADKIDPRVRELLAKAARLAIDAGVDFSADDLIEMDMHSRAVLVEAKKRERIEQACRIGRASLDDLGAAAIYSEVDDGEAHDELLLSRVLGADKEASDAERE